MNKILSKKKITKASGWSIQFAINVDTWLQNENWNQPHFCHDVVIASVYCTHKKDSKMLYLLSAAF